MYTSLRSTEKYRVSSACVPEIGVDAFKSPFSSCPCVLDPQFLHGRGREEVMKFVKDLYGFGDYAAGNVVMLLGFYEEVPMDSETVSSRG